MKFFTGDELWGHRWVAKATDKRTDKQTDRWTEPLCKALALRREFYKRKFLICSNFLLGLIRRSPVETAADFDPRRDRFLISTPLLLILSAQWCVTGATPTVDKSVDKYWFTLPLTSLDRALKQNAARCRHLKNEWVNEWMNEWMNWQHKLYTNNSECFPAATNIPTNTGG